MIILYTFIKESYIDKYRSFVGGIIFMVMNESVEMCIRDSLKTSCVDELFNVLHAVNVAACTDFDLNITVDIEDVYKRQPLCAVKQWMHRTLTRSVPLKPFLRRTSRCRDVYKRQEYFSGWSASLRIFGIM